MGPHCTSSTVRRSAIASSYRRTAAKVSARYRCSRGCIFATSIAGSASAAVSATSTAAAAPPAGRAAAVCIFLARLQARRPSLLACSMRAAFSGRRYDCSRPCCDCKVPACVLVQRNAMRLEHTCCNDGNITSPAEIWSFVCRAHRISKAIRLMSTALICGQRIASQQEEHASVTHQQENHPESRRRYSLGWRAVLFTSPQLEQAFSTVR